MLNRAFDTDFSTADRGAIFNKGQLSTDSPNCCWSLTQRKSQERGELVNEVKLERDWNDTTAPFDLNKKLNYESNNFTA